MPQGKAAAEHHDAVLQDLGQAPEKHKGRRRREAMTQQEWILTQSDWNRLKEHLVIGCTNQQRFLDSLRPHTPAPALNVDCDIHCEWFYTDCKGECKKLAEHDALIAAEAARTATLVENRRVLQEQYDWWLHNWKRLDAVRDYMNLLKESLRQQEQQ
jgi:hypothetical protein